MPSPLFFFSTPRVSQKNLPYFMQMLLLCQSTTLHTLNSETRGDQRYPQSLCTDDDTCSTVFASSYSPEGFSRVLMTDFDPQDAPTQEQAIELPLVSHQGVPYHARNPQGDVVITYTASDGDLTGIYGRYCTSAANCSTPVRINDITLGRQNLPRVVATENYWWVLWQSDRLGIGHNSDTVWGQLFDSSFTKKCSNFRAALGNETERFVFGTSIGNDTLHISYDAGFQSEARKTHDLSVAGNFSIVQNTALRLNNQSGVLYGASALADDGLSVLECAFTSNLAFNSYHLNCFLMTPVTRNIIVNFQVADQVTPAYSTFIAPMPQGGFLITYSSSVTTTYQEDIFSTLFYPSNASGILTDAQCIHESKRQGAQKNPSLVIQQDHAYVVYETSGGPLDNGIDIIASWQTIQPEITANHPSTYQEDEPYYPAATSKMPLFLLPAARLSLQDNGQGGTWHCPIDPLNQTNTPNLFIWQDSPASIATCLENLYYIPPADSLPFIEGDLCIEDSLRQIPSCIHFAATGLAVNDPPEWNCSHPLLSEQAICTQTIQDLCVLDDATRLPQLPDIQATVCGINGFDCSKTTFTFPLKQLVYDKDSNITLQVNMLERETISPGFDFNHDTMQLSIYITNTNAATHETLQWVISDESFQLRLQQKVTILHPAFNAQSTTKRFYPTLPADYNLPTFQSKNSDAVVTTTLSQVESGLLYDPITHTMKGSLSLFGLSYPSDIFIICSALNNKTSCINYTQNYNNALLQAWISIFTVIMFVINGTYQCIRAPSRAKKLQEQDHCCCRNLEDEPEELGAFDATDRAALQENRSIQPDLEVCHSIEVSRSSSSREQVPSLTTENQALPPSNLTPSA